jgi:hypothetical protein
METAATGLVTDGIESGTATVTAATGMVTGITATVVMVAGIAADTVMGIGAND